MKKTIVISFLTITALVLMMIIYTMYGRNVRETELSNGISTAIENAMGTLNSTARYQPDSNDEFIASFLEALLTEIDSKNNSVNVNVLAADYEKGLLDVEVVETYTHPNGKEGSVSVRRTAILEQYKNTPDVASYTVSFTLKDLTVEKQFTVQDGTTIIVPGDNGKKWVDDKENVVTAGQSLSITKDINYTEK